MNGDLDDRAQKVLSDHRAEIKLKIEAITRRKIDELIHDPELLRSMFTHTSENHRWVALTAIHEFTNYFDLFVSDYVYIIRTDRSLLVQSAALIALVASYHKTKDENIIQFIRSIVVDNFYSNEFRKYCKFITMSVNQLLSLDVASPSSVILP